MTILLELDRTRDETLGYFRLSAPDLERSYGPGKWPVRHILHHLADSELVLLERIRRILSEGRRVQWAFDQEAWASALDYAAIPLELSRDLYSACRAGIRHDAARYYESHGRLEWVHSETGVRTLKQEFDKVASHNADHLDQIRRALAR